MPIVMQGFFYQVGPAGHHIELSLELSALMQHLKEGVGPELADLFDNPMGKMDGIHG
jgi:hypothetical protein